MKKGRGGSTNWDLYRPVRTPTGKICTPCRELKVRVARLESDYADIVKANIRLVMWAKEQKVKIPTDFKLKKQFPLADYD